MGFFTFGIRSMRNEVKSQASPKPSTKTMVLEMSDADVMVSVRSKNDKNFETSQNKCSHDLYFFSITDILVGVLMS